MIRIMMFIIAVLLMLHVQAQQERSHVRKGNKYYSEGDLEKASNEYNDALGIKNDLTEGVFNLGNVAFKKQEFEQAAEKFETAAMMSEDRQVKAKAFHNMGNTFMEAKQYDKSVEAYKNALRLDPKDEATRYNLAYAQEMLRKNPPQDQEQQQDQDQDQDQKDDQEKKDQDQQSEQQKQDEQQKEQQDQQAENQQGEKEEGEQKTPQPREGQLTKEEALRLLEALKDEEQKLQEELAKKKIKAEKREIEKDW